MLKKTMLLASMALAVAAFAVPAVASAEGTITHDGQPVPTNNVVELTLSGFMEFDIPALDSGYGCDVEATVELVSGHPSTGTTSFDIVNTETCVGTGLLADCELVEDETNAPYHVAVSSEDFTVTKPGGVIEINNLFDEGCIVPAAQLTFNEVTMTPDDPTSISTVTLSGEGVNDAIELPFLVTGDLSVEPAGTYGLE